MQKWPVAKEKNNQNTDKNIFELDDECKNHQKQNISNC